MIRPASQSVLERILAPVGECLTPDVAKRIAETRVDSSLQQQLDDLAAKANVGTLSDEEREEYEELIDGLELLAVLKAHARLVVARQAEQ
jgi:hypothetical protein